MTMCIWALGCVVWRLFSLSLFLLSTVMWMLHGLDYGDPLLMSKKGMSSKVWETWDVNNCLLSRGCRLFPLCGAHDLSILPHRHPQPYHRVLVLSWLVSFFESYTSWGWHWRECCGTLPFLNLLPLGPLLPLTDSSSSPSCLLYLSDRQSCFLGVCSSFRSLHSAFTSPWRLEGCRLGTQAQLTLSAWLSSAYRLHSIPLCLEFWDYVWVRAGYKKLDMVHPQLVLWKGAGRPQSPRTISLFFIYLFKKLNLLPFIEFVSQL